MAFSHGSCFKLDESGWTCVFVVVFDPDERGWVISVDDATGKDSVMRGETGELPEVGKPL